VGGKECDSMPESWLTSLPVCLYVYRIYQSCLFVYVAIYAY